MEIRNSVIERVLKSFAFSAVLFAVWGWVAASHARALAKRFEIIECAWLAYNAAISVLFLIRTRPTAVSMNPFHWLVALVTSFAGFFFRRYDVPPQPCREMVSEGLIFAGVALGLGAALALGRSYDFLPALRGVQTRSVYGLVRHPMYVSSMVFRLGYLVRHASIYNLAVFAVMVWLYDRRAAFEEGIMYRDSRYRAYAEKVRFRFLPGLY